MPQELFTAETEGGWFLRAEGHITAARSLDLRRHFVERLERPPLPGSFCVDLSACDYMDSTFMGLLVGFHKKARALTGRSLSLYRPTADCGRLLAGLGIAPLFTVVTAAPAGWPSVWTALPSDQSATLDLLADAHRNLSEVSDDNARRFASLQKILEDQLKEGQ